MEREVPRSCASHHACEWGIVRSHPCWGLKTVHEKPIEADVVIVDEASMIDVPLGAALISAMGDAARLVIVGDADQLPSVGPGALLRDIIDSGVVTTVRLNEIFRQAGESRIVQNAHRILTGEMSESADPESPRADFFVVSRRVAGVGAQRGVILSRCHPVTYHAAHADVAKLADAPDSGSGGSKIPWRFDSSHPH